MDPYPSGLHTGRDEIKAFIQSGFDGCETMTFEVEEVHPVADKAAIRFQITLAWRAAPPCTSGRRGLHRHRRRPHQRGGGLLG